MKTNFKELHIGQMIEKRIEEKGIEMFRLCRFFKCSEDEILNVYSSKSLDTEVLLRWSKLLKYDFFRIYTQHMIFYAPVPSPHENQKTGKSSLPQFRKNIYTKEMIDFILERIETGEITKSEVIERYGIPKTTLYKWIKKYRK